jgi:hypothetical protein
MNDLSFVEGFLEDYVGKPHIVFERDCFSFIRDYCTKLKGFAPSPEILYSTREESLEMAKKYKWSDYLLASYKDSSITTDPVDGGICIISDYEGNNGFEIAGIIKGVYVYLFTEKEGLRRIYILKCDRMGVPTYIKL